LHDGSGKSYFTSFALIFVPCIPCVSRNIWLIYGRLLALKQSTIKSESRVIAQNHDFNDDAGSALSSYATSIVDVQQDESPAKKPIERSIARREKPKTGIQTRIKLARELKIGIDGNSKFVVKAVVQHVDVDVRGRKGRTALSHTAEAGM
jgi:hypothetical protein